MKAKLTVSVDATLVAQAKRDDQLQRVPISRSAKEPVATVVLSASGSDGDAFIRRWQGSMKAPPYESDGARLTAIQAKHLR